MDTENIDIIKEIMIINDIVGRIQNLRFWRLNLNFPFESEEYMLTQIVLLKSVASIHFDTD